VRHAAGQPAHGFHLLCLAELLLEPALRGDVLAHLQVVGRASLLVAHRTDGGFLFVGRAVLAPLMEDPVPFVAAAQGVPEQRVLLGFRVVGFEDAVGLADNLRERIAGELGEPPVGVLDLPFEVGDDNHRRNLLDDQRHFAEIELGAPMRPPGVRVTQFAPDSWSESVQPVFRHVVVRPGPHDLGGEVFTDRPRDQNERQVAVAIVDQRQRLEPAELRHLEVGQHHVPRLGGKRRRHVDGRLHPAPRHLDPGPLQLANGEFGVDVRVVGDERLQRDSAHRSPAVSFTVSQ